MALKNPAYCRAKLVVPQRKPGGPCAWAARRASHLLPIQNATKKPRPILVGAGFRRLLAAALAGGTAALGDGEGDFHHFGEGVLAIFGGQGFAGDETIRDGQKRQGVLARCRRVQVQCRRFHFHAQNAQLG